MSALSRSDGSNNYYASSESMKNDATPYTNGTQVPIATTTLSSFNANGIHTGGNLFFNSSVMTGATAAAASSMALKREFQDEDSSCTDDSSSGPELQPNGKVWKFGDGVVDYSMTSPSYSSTDSNPINSSGSRRSTGSRRSYPDEKLSPEEEERRKLRRERNKVAAAKCRQKRVDLTNQLLAETKTLEDEQSQLEDKIKTFQQQKEELEFILEAHRVHCGAPVLPSVPAQETKLHKSKELNSKEVLSDVSSASGLQQQKLLSSAKVTAIPGSSIVTEVPGVQAPLMSSDASVHLLGLPSVTNGRAGLTPVTGLASEVVPTSENFAGKEVMNLSFETSSNTRLTTL